MMEAEATANESIETAALLHPARATTDNDDVESHLKQQVAVCSQIMPMLSFCCIPWCSYLGLGVSIGRGRGCQQIDGNGRLQARQNIPQGVVLQVCATLLFASSHGSIKQLGKAHPEITVVLPLWIRYIIFVTFATTVATRCSAAGLGQVWRTRAPGLQVRAHAPDPPAGCHGGWRSAIIHFRQHRSHCDSPWSS